LFFFIGVKTTKENMKKMIFAALAIVGVACMTSQAQTKSDTGKTKPMKAQMTKVAAADVPAAITASLKNPEYAGWTIGDIYTNPDKTRYMVHATKGAEKKRCSDTNQEAKLTF
jgi:hypothetical protein